VDKLDKYKKDVEELKEKFILVLTALEVTQNEEIFNKFKKDFKDSLSCDEIELISCKLSTETDISEPQFELCYSIDIKLKGSNDNEIVCMNCRMFLNEEDGNVCEYKLSEEEALTDFYSENFFRLPFQRTLTPFFINNIYRVIDRLYYIFNAPTKSI